MQNEDWRDDALCQQVDPEIFHPKHGEHANEAKAVCKQCKVSEQCLQWALDNREPWGIYGGKSPRERLRLRAKRRAA